MLGVWLGVGGVARRASAAAFDTCSATLGPFVPWYEIVVCSDWIPELGEQVVVAGPPLERLPPEALVPLEQDSQARVSSPGRARVLPPG